MHGFPCGSGSAAAVQTQPPGPPSVTKHTKLRLKVKLSGQLSASEENPEITFGQIAFREKNKKKKKNKLIMKYLFE